MFIFDRIYEYEYIHLSVNKRGVEHVDGLQQQLAMLLVNVSFPCHRIVLVLRRNQR